MHAAPSPDHRDDAAVQLSDQAIGRIVDGEPLPGDAALVAETLRRHPEMFARLEQHLAIDAMLYDQAGPDADAFVDAVRVAIEAEMSRPAFVRKVRQAIFGGSPDNHAVAAPAQTVTAARSIWSGRSVRLLLACSLLLASLVAGGIWNAAAIGEPVLVEVDRTEGVTGFQAGDRLHLRALVLPEGSVDMKLGSGVRLECQAPLMARFEHPMRLHLSRGRVDVDVGDDGFGFTVVTPAGEVVDLGTKFSVNASADGEVRVAVFSGQVELRHKQSGAVNLFDGEAVRLTKSQAPRRLHSVEIRNRGLGDSRQAAVISGVSDNVKGPKLRRFYGLVPCGMRDGVRAFRDRRETRWQAEPGDVFPEELVGADLIQTFQRHRFRQDFRMTFATSQPSRIYVFYDARYSPPDWLARDFVNTGRRILSTGWSPTTVTRGLQPDPWGTLAIPHDIWCRDLIQPATVTLGPPVLPEHDLKTPSEFEAVLPSMYGIAVQPIAPPPANIGSSEPRQVRAKAVPVATKR
jgi:anti-sigma factor RsiW